MDNDTGAGYETQGGSRVAVCPALGPAASPFSPAAQAETWCWSRRNGLNGNGDEFGLTARRPGLAVVWKFPMLIAAVDPAAEAKLDDLPHALTSGHYLAENAAPGTIDSGKHFAGHLPGAGRGGQRHRRVRPKPRCGGWPIRPGRRR